MLVDQVLSLAQLCVQLLGKLSVTSLLRILYFKPRVKIIIFNIVHMRYLRSGSFISNCLVINIFLRLITFELHDLLGYLFSRQSLLLGCLTLELRLSLRSLSL